MRIPLICLFSLVVYSCRHYAPEAGDLLFQVTPGSQFSDAITDVTSGRQGIPYTHAALVVPAEGGTMVLEAVPEAGVRLVSLATFLDHSARLNGRPLVLVARLRDRRGVDEACRRAQTLLGRPYDEAFLPGDDALYCSELIQVSFLDDQGHPLFPSRPMNFRDSTGRIAPFWQEHYARLDMAVPEGVPGTNPGALSEDPALEAVHTFF